jgi:hypothetical protein
MFGLCPGSYRYYRQADLNRHLSIVKNVRAKSTGIVKPVFIAALSGWSLLPGYSTQDAVCG